MDGIIVGRLLSTENTIFILFKLKPFIFKLKLIFV